MSPKAFYLAGSEVLFIANSASVGERYTAQRHVLPPGAQTAARRHDTRETVVVVAAGTVEFMVGGAAGPVAAGSFVRIPAGATYACRNAGDGAATLLVRTIGPPRRAPSVSVTVSFAAA